MKLYEGMGNEHQITNAIVCLECGFKDASQRGKCIRCGHIHYLKPVEDGIKGINSHSEEDTQTNSQTHLISMQSCFFLMVILMMLWILYWNKDVIWNIYQLN